MATIPASSIVNVIPGVLSAGGNELVLNGLMLTNSTRVPIDTVPSFPTAPAVGSYFGLASNEYARATIYFLGFDNSTAKPTALLFAQYPSAAVAAYLRSSPITGLTLQQIQALSGSLTVLFDGAPRTATVNLSSATSYTAAASLIQAAINGTQVSDATFTASIAPATASFTGSIAGNVLTVTTLTTGTLAPGATITGTGVSSTQITSQISGTPGGTGSYEVSVAQVVSAGAMTAAYGTMTVTAMTSGTISVGQTVYAVSGVTAGTLVTALGTGTGLTGTYIVSPSQTTTSGTLQTIATPITAAFDSVSGSIVLSSGDVGAASTAGYASGALAASLGMTAATGAVLSQGADAAQPGTFMPGIVSLTQNWCAFRTLFDPDGGSGNQEKLAFAQWANTTGKRYAYVCRDTDPSPALSNSASTSLGALIASAGYDGTILVWEPATQPEFGHADFALSVPPSTDFNAINGRATFAFKSQSGLVASVTDATTAANLIANGYNYYGVYATANQNFVFFYPGSVSGKFLWADSYIDEIWLNNGLQLALIVLLTTIKSIPYNAAGYALIQTACQDPINAGLNFGAIRTGVTLSLQQQAEINTAAGKIAAPVIIQQGYYLQVLDASPQVRAARGSPPCNFWYADGQSVQKIVLNSIIVQ